MIYTALTIGPIIKTLQSVKSTKAIWTASYIFSYLIKQIIIEIKKLSGIEIILPYSDEIDGKNPLTEPYRAGLFPDRIIIMGDVDLKKIIDAVIKQFADHSKISENYLKQYFNFYHLKIELGYDTKILLQIYNMLDSMELQQRVLVDANNSDLIQFFEKKRPYNFLIQNEFAARPFPSTIEIAMAEYEEKYGDDERYIEAVKKLKKGEDENQIDFIKDIKAIVSDSFRNYQKYIAVVQADGDNIGSFIKFLYEQSNKADLIERFSKNLLSFAIEAVKLIQAFKGTPIYAGGDDLLFFAPVAHSSYNSDTKQFAIKKTIFTLIHELDEKFKIYFNDDSVFSKIIEKAVEEFAKRGEYFKTPTISYGVSISYYKFPLNQALEEGLNQLFYTAKKTDKKNAVSYTVLKHSGQFFGTTYHKDEDSYTTFNELIKENLVGDNFVHSIIYKLEPQKEVIKAIGVGNLLIREMMFDNFFENNFNENIHRKKENKKELIPILEKTKQLFKEVYSENELKGSVIEINKKNEENLTKIYSALRFIDFIHNKEEHDD